MCNEGKHTLIEEVRGYCDLMLKTTFSIWKMANRRNEKSYVTWAVLMPITA